MASNTPDHAKISGIKSYLLRNSSLEDLRDLATKVFNQAVEDVTITGTSAEGGSANGEVTLPKWVYLNAIEECIAVLDPTASIQTRQLGTRPDFSNLRWSV
jgi:hypothetical protein